MPTFLLIAPHWFPEELWTKQAGQGGILLKPESGVVRPAFLTALEDDWKPLPRWAVLAWLAFYAVFLFQLARGSGLLPMIDLVFVPVHEGGHLLFGYFGHGLMVAGGTILQLSVPLALAAYFCLQRQIAGTAFCLFCFFEQFLPIATYMADARAQELPLLTVGDPELVEHDWFVMFSGLGVLEHDTQIASLVRCVGWMGMFAVAGWLLWRALAKVQK
jgi:hypothetical protein